MPAVPTRLHLVLAFFGFAALATAETFELTEASIADINAAFDAGALSSAACWLPAFRLPVQLAPISPEPNR